MNLAKGLEFKAVAVMAYDDEMRAGFDTERYLFYVACTRAYDRLQISGAKPVSEFLGDIGARGVGQLQPAAIR